MEKSLKKGRQAVFFSTVIRWKTYYDMGETPCDLTKPRIMSYKNNWNRLQNTVFWCNLKLVQGRNLQFYQTRSHAVVLLSTQLAACIGKVACMKTEDELYQKVRYNSENATCRTKIEIVIWPTKSSKPRRKIILGSIERFEK